MPDKTYTIAKCVDTVIVLRQPLTDFAVWQQDEPETSPTVSDDDTTPDNPESAGSDTSSNLMNISTTPETIEQTNILEGVAAISLAECGNAEVSLLNPQPALNDESRPASKQPLAAPVDGIHYLCSSAHLKQSSYVFETELSGDWKESVPRDDGRYYIIVEDWDEDALRTLLNILHLRHREVPKKTTLEKLAMIAKMVDFYQCHEAVDLYSPVWIKFLIRHRRLAGRQKFTQEYGRDAIMWLCIACVFKQWDIFEDITEVMIYKGEHDECLTLGLPIPNSVTELISERRTDLLKYMVGRIERFVDQLNTITHDGNGEETADSCRSIMLGEARKEVADFGLEPQANQSFDGRSVAEVYHKCHLLDRVRQHACGTDMTMHFTIARQVHVLGRIGLKMEECFSELQMKEIDRFWLDWWWFMRS